LREGVAFAALLWVLAVSHPIVWVQAQNAAGRDGTQPHAAARYVALLESTANLRETLREQEKIGYASEAEIDTRTGSGGLEARYYLSQFALAPILVELESGKQASEHEFILANFDLPEQLSTYLSEHARRVVITVNEYVALTRARAR
jgi:hypothetical protein